MMVMRMRRMVLSCHRDMLMMAVSNTRKITRRSAEAAGEQQHAEERRKALSRDHQINATLQILVAQDEDFQSEKSRHDSNQIVPNGTDRKLTSALLRTYKPEKACLFGSPRRS
jgi:hypothetical protein